MTNTNTSNQNTYKDNLAALDDISKQREEWEQGAFKTSNEQLYAILARCLDIYELLRGRDSAQVRQRKELDERLAKMGITVRESTNLATKVIRYVFRTDRKRSYAYARVILSAVEHNIDSVKLAKWVRDNDGIEEVRRKQNGELTNSQLKKMHTEAAEQHLHSANALVAPFKAVAELKASAESTSCYTLALVRCDADGNASIVYGDNNQTLVKQMLARAGKKLQADAKIKSVIVAERSRKAKRAAAITKAA